MSHIIVDTTDDEAVIVAVQQTRIKMVNKLMLDGDIPTDKESMFQLKELLKDVSGTAVARVRVAAQTKATENQSDLIKALIVGSMKQIGSTNPFLVANQYIDGTARDVTPENSSLGRIPSPPDAFVPEFQPVPGEMDVGLEPFIYSDFMAKTEHLDIDEE